MCGISGIISSVPIKAECLLKMNKIIHYRGPDDEGYVFSNLNGELSVLGDIDTPKNVFSSDIPYAPQAVLSEVGLDKSFQIGLGHRRLSILDLSVDGHMPMSDNLKRYWITFNGEVYNFIEIKEDLEKRGYEFRSSSDTEVILAAYMEWGAECLNKFVGMFSFAILDRESQEVFLVRDRFGIKPLYYWVSSSGVLYFGSEIKQFTVCDQWESKLNHQRVFDYLFYSLTDHTEETMFNGVYQIKPGHASILDLKNLNLKGGGKIAQFKWYNPELSAFTGTFEEAKDKFKALFDSSIKLHLRSDVPVGFTLSGGLDSSAIVCTVDQIKKSLKSPGAMYTFSSVNENPQFSEKSWMDEVTKRVTAKSTYVYPDVETLIETLPKIIYHMDEPYQSQSAFLGYQVYQAAGKEDIKVILTGQGADEYLSGYGLFRKLRIHEMVRKFRIKEFSFESNKKGLKILPDYFNILAQIVVHNFSLGIKQLLRSNKRDYKKIKSLLNGDKLRYKFIHPLENFDQFQHNHITNSKHQLSTNPLPRYLRWEDRNSMAHSIEARVPFLDHRLVEFCHSLPLDYLDGKDKTKMILTESMEGILPKIIQERKDKKGFITPEEDWVKSKNPGDFRKLLEKSIAYSEGIINKKAALNYYDGLVKGEVPFDFTYWRLILLGFWMNRFNVKL